MKLHQIVIVGGGAGGLELATRLGHKLGKKQRAKIILVDTKLTHIWKPLLHQVASGALNPAEDEISYFAHAKTHHFEFQLGHMSDINQKNKTIKLDSIIDPEGKVWTESRHIAYDTLILAIGSVSHDFGVVGAKEHALFLDSRVQADRFHQTLIYRYLKLHSEAAETKKSLNIAIIGAGATGVELAAELIRSSQQLAFYGLDDVQSDQLEITIIEGANQILPALSERISLAVKKHLTKLGVTLQTNCVVKEVQKTHIITQDDTKISADITAWTAGVKAPDFLSRITELETNKINQLIVKPTLQTTKNSDIFAIGDCAFCLQKNGKPVPPRAQAAHQQASMLVKSMQKKVNGKSLPNFHYRDYGSLISLSEFNVVGNLMSNLTPNLPLEGKLAKVFYVSLYRLHQISLHGVFQTMILIIRDWLAHRTKPRLKLH